MKVWILIALSLVACEKKSKQASGGDDCEVIRKSPQSATAILSKKYPGNAQKVALTIEGCVAPASADECDRVAALIKAIPSMAPSIAAPSGSDADVATACRMTPAEARHCYLPSYALAHDVECTKVREKLAIVAHDQVMPPTHKCDAGSIDVYVTAGGTWVITGKDPASRCFGARKGTELDREWLKKELAPFSTAPCAPSVLFAADEDVLYKDIIGAMDVSVSARLPDTQLADKAELGVTLESDAPAKVPQHCPQTTIPNPPVSAAGPGSASGGGITIPASGVDLPSDELSKAPVVIVTKDAISVGGKQIITVKKAASGTGSIDELRSALPLPASSGSPLILQADQDTPAGVINRVISSTKAAGWDEVLFAVKNK